MARGQPPGEAPAESRPGAAAAQGRAASVKDPRVCYVAEAFYPSTGGTETQGRLLVESIVAQALEVVVVTNRVPATSKREERLFGARIRRVSPAADKPGAQRWAMMLTVFVELLRQRATYDVIFVAGFRTLGVPAVAAAKLLGKKTVLRPANAGEMSGAFFDPRLQKYGLSHSHPLVRLIVRARNALLRRADVFVPNTTDVRDEILGEGVDPDKVILVPNAYEAGRFAPAASKEKARLRQRLGIEESRPVAVFVGRLVAWKGPQHLARIWRDFAAAGNPSLLLLVGPDGNDMHDCADEIRAFVRAHGLERHVRMTGGVDNVEDYLRAADLFVFPSQGGETATTAVIEAMACGLPVVTTIQPGVRDLVTDEVGRLVERDDLAGLGSAIEALLQDPTRRAALGRAAADRAQRLYSASVVHSRYIEIFRRLHL